MALFLMSRRLLQFVKMYQKEERLRLLVKPPNSCWEGRLETLLQSDLLKMESLQTLQSLKKCFSISFKKYMDQNTLDPALECLFVFHTDQLRLREGLLESQQKAQVRVKFT